jgi:hypothetical protein
MKSAGSQTMALAWPGTPQQAISRADIATPATTGLPTKHVRSPLFVFKATFTRHPHLSQVAPHAGRCDTLPK